jgi:hypothetical protein
MRNRLLPAMLTLSAAVLIFSSCANKIKKDEILAVVGDRVITTDEFIRRAEYTIRPPYCKMDYYLQKKIVFNSLIAEKLFALEAGEDNPLVKNTYFQDQIRGRKEQLMRETLYYKEAMNKVKVDTADVKKRYKAAGREYKIAFFSVGRSAAQHALQQQIRDGEEDAFNDLYRQVAGFGPVPERKVSWQGKEDPVIHQAMFGEPLKKGQVLGPIKVDDNQYLMVKVLGWIDRPVITDTASKQRWEDVSDEIKREKASIVWDRYIGNLMKGKKLLFQEDAFKKMAKFLLPIYFKTDQEEKEMLNSIYWNNEQPNLSPDSSEVNEKNFIQMPFFTMDGKTYTVDDFKSMMDTHPLVFRKKKMSRGEFPEQLKFAIADMIRDRFITQKAYDRGLDRSPYIDMYANMWKDSFVSFYQRNRILKSRGAKGDPQKEYMQHLNLFLNPYADTLFQKYSPEIKVNIPNFEKIQLTRIDMIVRHEGMPYPDAVPTFPILTTRNRMDYGSQLK